MENITGHVFSIPFCLFCTDQVWVLPLYFLWEKQSRLGLIYTQCINSSTPMAVLNSVNFGCFVPSRSHCFHCNAMRKVIKACTNLHAIQQIRAHPMEKNISLVHLIQPCIAIYICSNRRSIPKVENFFEVIVPRMAPKHFRRYFRMYEDTLESINIIFSSCRTFYFLTE